MQSKLQIYSCELVIFGFLGKSSRSFVELIQLKNLRTSVTFNNVTTILYLLYQSTNRWNLQFTLIARDEECCFIFFRHSWNAIEEEAITLSVYYYCVFRCCCCSFYPSLCRLSRFLLSYVAVSRSCRLSEF